MICCDNLIHPFQHDPGVSQRQRVIEDLLSGLASIDGRTLAALLNYFTQLSRQINYYDAKLNVSDWQPFFQKSIPFSLVSIIEYNKDTKQKKINYYNQLFDKRPNRHSLQLIIHFIYNHTIRPVNQWHQQTKGSELPAERVIEKLIKDKLSGPVKKFLCLTNFAVQKYKISKLDISQLMQNDVWNLPLDEIKNTNCFTSSVSGKRKRLIALRNEIINLFPGLLSSISLAGAAAELSMEQSLFPLKEELQKKHSPHLALLFAFLKLFNHLQGDLNSYTKKHLDFFYQDVLKLKPRPAVADKAHIIFEIQKQLDKYLLKKNLQVKDGKDNKKAEIYFALDDEIVVNKTEVADVRTLFLNNRLVQTTSYTEGVYMAPDARKADGVKIDFKDDGPLNWPTLGSKFSKYTDPEQKFIKPYPNARIGFILASPVLLLNEGTRTVTITLDCELHNDYCNELKKKKEESVQKNCCQSADTNAADDDRCKKAEIEQLSACKIYEEVTKELNKKYYYISKALIQEAIKKGISNDIILRLRKFLLSPNPPDKLCYCPTEKYTYDTVVSKDEFENEAVKGFTDDQVVMLSEIFKPERVFKIYFSGEKEWIEPSDIIEMNVIESPKITMTPASVVCPQDNTTPATYAVTITIKAILNPDKPSVTFFNKEKLKEDIDTELPVVKVELNDHIKLRYPGTSMISFLSVGNTVRSGCCLNTPINLNDQYISLYHFFRNIKFNRFSNTKIDVQVCGLKNFIVQNDESVMDVNGPVYPFGARPDVPDFTVDTISKVYCITQELIDDAVVAGISVATKNYLESVLGPKKTHRLKSDLEDFLKTIPTAADKPILQGVFNNPAKNYCALNLVGPDFYIGSKEVFCKKWNDVYVNINWKEKPDDFNEHYKAYWVDPTDFSKYGINEDNFQINISVLDNGFWRKEKVHALLNPPPANTILNPDTGDNNRPLFKNDILAPFCTVVNPVEQSIHVSKFFFDNYQQQFQINGEEIKKYSVDTPFGFLKINLQNQDFLHKNYPFVLARQMMALGKFPKEFLEGATYLTAGGTVFVFESTASKLVELDQLIGQTLTETNQATNAAQLLDARVTLARDPSSASAEDITDAEFTTNPDLDTPLQSTVTNTAEAFQKATDMQGKYVEIKNSLSIFDLFTGKVVEKLAVLIPNEPWTPIIKNISLDYTATATITDIDLIHLYPYKDTYKAEEIELQPTLFPTFCDEGTIYIGLKGLVPGTNLNMLFQLAEATADSELEREEVVWHYLDNNQWKTLRKGFEVTDDATEDLTTSGIIKFALPENMTNDNTILPKDLHWIKASIPRNSQSVSETIGIHTQAIQVVFTNENENDKLRLNTPLPAGSVSKLKEADANVKKVDQPYDSFGGREPEVEKQYYVRVSELLRHKGRAIQKWDYERITLEAFPNIYRVKCINHSFALNAHRYINDFPVAPGYVLLAVIPDLTKLKAGNSFEPKAPVSLLEDINEYIRKKTSPFVRLKVMNPRYEKVEFCLKVKLYKGKDENYYKEKLKEDLREFLAPWAIGEYSKLSFGQCVNRSDLVRFMEGLDYIDYIIDLKMKHAMDSNGIEAVGNQNEVCPNTPRSILVAGEIDVCIGQDDCDKWDERGICSNQPEKIIDYCKQPGVIN